MPLPTPVLDDRSFQQLRDEIVRRIPVYAPEWTDHNASDPGITLIELFAFLAENLLFRFNQIPEATKLEFLHRLQIPLRPAAVAGTIVAMSTERPQGDLVPKGTEAKAGKVSFETEDEVHVWPITARAVARAATEPPAPEDKEAWDFLIRARDARRLASDEQAVYYTTRTVPSEPAAPGSLPVDFREAVDGSLWVAVIGGKGADKAAVAGGILNLGLVLDQAVAPDEQIDACPGGAVAPPSPAMTWQVSTGRLENGRPEYRTVAVVGDSTRGLTQDGVLRIQLPRSVDDLGGFDVADPDLTGTGDLPPDLGDDEATAALLFWLRAFRPSDDAPIGRILWVGANAASVAQWRTARPEFLGTGTGDADQRYRLINRPVIPDTLALDVEEGGQWTRWMAVGDFQASGEDDRHFVVDLEAGQVRFGNGVRGRAPQIGERIRAVSYRYGGGPDGNVAEGALSKLEGFPAVKVGNPLPARGGAPAETIAEGLERIPGELRRRDRAVAPGDFRELALAAPGGNVGRAEVLPLFHPDNPGVPAAGVVTLVVWPKEDPKHPSAPVPDRTLLRTVCAWLDSRRLVTTELYVRPPSYRKVAVAVGLQVKPGYGVEAVRHWVELVIRQYLAPLPPYGPDGGGWPLGRRVHGPELEAAALQVEGVEYLEGLTVAALAPDGSRWVSGTVVLEPYEVPELAEITVVKGTPLDPGIPLAPPEPPKTPIPIPVVKEEC